MIADGQAAATLAVSDMDRARKFYEGTLGFSVMQETPMGLMFRSGSGTGFFVYPSEFAGTNKATAMSINVDDVEGTVADLRAKGVSFMEFDYPGFEMKDGVAQTPEGPGAWFTDPDGNIISIAQMPSLSM
jgi:catechol 2,3-dioxygenase-like lactoylglutathione lyase family enzyme